MNPSTIFRRGPINLKEYIFGVTIICITGMMISILFASIGLFWSDIRPEKEVGKILSAIIAFIGITLLLTIIVCVVRMRMNAESSNKQFLFCFSCIVAWFAIEISPAFLLERIPELLSLVVGAAIVIPVILWAGKQLTDPKLQSFIRSAQILVLPAILFSSSATNQAKGFVVIASILMMVRYGFEFTEFKTSRADMMKWGMLIFFEGAFLFVYAARLIYGISLL